MVAILTRAIGQSSPGACLDKNIGSNQLSLMKRSVRKHFNFPQTTSGQTYC